MLLAVILALRAVPRRWVLGALLVGVAFPVAGILSTEVATSVLLDPFRGGRYFYLTGAILAAIVLIGLNRRSRYALPLAALMAVGIINDAKIPPIPTVGWAEKANCIGGPQPCSVPVAPLLTPSPGAWSVDWRPQS